MAPPAARAMLRLWRRKLDIRADVLHHRLVVPYPPQMPMAPPPPKRGMSGCMIALLVVGIVALVGTCAVGAGVYMFATSKVGKTAIKVVGESTRLAEKGLNAPGTPELRALGCQQAMVMDMKDWSELVNDLVDAGPDSGIDGLMISCQVTGRATPPSCDDVAKTYIRAVGRARAEFIVSVQRQGDSNPTCQANYDTTGALIGSASAGGI